MNRALFCARATSARRVDTPYLTHGGGAHQVLLGQESEHVNEAIADQVWLMEIHTGIDNVARPPHQLSPVKNYSERGSVYGKHAGTRRFCFRFLGCAVSCSAARCRHCKRLGGSRTETHRRGRARHDIQLKSG